MTINKTALENDLRDNTFPNNATTGAPVAVLWEASLNLFAANVVPASTAVNAAGVTLIGALTPAFSTGGTPASIAGTMELAFFAWATTIGLGMAPAYIAIPPPTGGIGLLAEFSKPEVSWPVTHAAAATIYANLFDTWMKLGTAQISGGPPPPPVFWS